MQFIQEQSLFIQFLVIQNKFPSNYLLFLKEKGLRVGLNCNQNTFQFINGDLYFFMDIYNKNHLNLLSRQLLAYKSWKTIILVNQSDQQKDLAKLIDIFKFVDKVLSKDVDKTFLIALKSSNQNSKKTFLKELSYKFKIIESAKTMKVDDQQQVFQQLAIQIQKLQAKTFKLQRSIIYKESHIYHLFSQLLHQIIKSQPSWTGDFLQQFRYALELIDRNIDNKEFKFFYIVDEELQLKMKNLMWFSKTDYIDYLVKITESDSKQFQKAKKAMLRNLIQICNLSEERIRKTQRLGFIRENLKPIAIISVVVVLCLIILYQSRTNSKLSIQLAVLNNQNINLNNHIDRLKTEVAKLERCQGYFACK